MDNIEVPKNRGHRRERISIEEAAMVYIDKDGNLQPVKFPEVPKADGKEQMVGWGDTVSLVKSKEQWIADFENSKNLKYRETYYSGESFFKN